MPSEWHNDTSVLNFSLTNEEMQAKMLMYAEGTSEKITSLEIE